MTQSKKLDLGDITLCRRITGGGVVDHRNDWTYALVLHSSVEAAQRKSDQLYQDIHRSILNTLKQQDVDAQLAPCPKACGQDHVTAHSSTPSQCFVHPVAYDVLSCDGMKIAGAAMKRSRSALLIQGSIERSTLPNDFDYAQFAQRLPELLAEQLEIPTGTSEDIRALFDGPLIQAERERFNSIDWTQKR